MVGETPALRAIVRRVTLLRSLPALALLVILAAPYWPRQIDDQFITLAFAWEWAERGRIAWTTGEVVEGFSSFTQLALGAGAFATGMDANLLVKRLALGSGLAVLLLGGLRLPAGGGVLLVALAVWQPLAAWSGLGLEMTLFAFLISLAWMEVVRPTRSWIAPVVFLVAAFTRPEGNGHLVAGLLARAVLSRRVDGWAIGSVLGWLALHGWRVATFGHLLPTPFLVKVQVPFDPWRSAGRLGGDLLTGAGALLAAGVLFPSGSARRWVAVVPLAIQAALALGSQVDWMANGRFLLPGLTAALLVWGVASQPCSSSGRLLLASLLALAGGALRPETEREIGVGLRSLPWDPDPIALYGSTFDTPCFTDLEWMVPGAPAGADVFTADVGMPGNIPDIALHDLGGLTDREIAEQSAHPSDAGEAALRSRFSGRTPMRVRIINYHRGSLGAWPRWLDGSWTGPSYVHAEQDTIGVYATDSAVAPPELVEARWRALHERYPSQGPLTWAYAVALAARDLPAAVDVATKAARRFPRDRVLAALPSALWDGRGPDAWETPDARAAQVQGPFPPLDLALAVALRPDLGQRCRVTVKWECSTERAEVWTDDVAILPIPPLTCAATAPLQVDLSGPCEEAGIGVVVGFAADPTELTRP